jgi:hypothetical protein
MTSLGRLVGFFTRNAEGGDVLLTGPSPIHRGFTEEAEGDHRATRPMSSGKCAKYPIEVVTHAPNPLLLHEIGLKEQLAFERASAQHMLCTLCKSEGC